ncbi:MAG: site-specific DNA-methyltransferase, partial [Ruminococcus sp.]|nr:site-specific DNA-methyltransferase [Ruminococcus sp.]
PDGQRVNTPDNKPWRASEATFLEWENNNMIVFKKTNTSPLIDEDTGEKASWNLYTKSYLSDRKEIGTQPRNIITDCINRKGADLLRKMDIPFDFAKPVELLYFLIKTINSSDGIIMDFFSGSATTAHAVMQLNAEDGGHRKFIMVQLPEETAEDSEAFKAGYKNICEIGKERIRRAGAKIKEESPMTTQNLDTGFRVLKLDDTNMQDVYYTPAETDQQMLSGFESNIKPDRTDLDLLFGCLLDWGLPLSMPYSSEQIEGVTVHTYNDGDLIACFDKAIPESVIKTIAKRQPLRVVFRDDSFADSPSKINVSEIFKMLSPDTRVKVI